MHVIFWCLIVVWSFINISGAVPKLQSGHDFVKKLLLKKYGTLNVSLQELWFLRSARCLMLVNICMKFHGDTMNGFKVTERKLLLAKFKGAQLKKYKYKSYGSCILYVVWCWLVFVWSFMKVPWTVFELQNGHDHIAKSTSFNFKGQ